MRKITKEEFIQRASTIHNNKYFYDKVNYVNTSTKVTITCPIHGDFELTPDNHLHGKGCPKCVKNYKLTLKEFIRRAKEIHNGLYDYSLAKYSNILEKVTIICPKHGKFEQRPVIHLLGCRCPKYSLHSLTILYNKLIQRYPKLDILFEVGNKTVPWLERQRFDIYIPSLNIAIEYNGHLHYMPIKYFGGELVYQKTLEKDELKKYKCKKNDCLLLEVKYNYTNEDFNNLCNQIDDRTDLILKCEKGGKINDVE